MANRIRSANRDLMRRMNEALVLGIVHDFGPISRSEIADEAGLSLAAISSIAGSLIEQGIVIEESRGESTGGRRPILLVINSAAALVIGVKLPREQIIVALTDLGGELVEQRACPLGDDLHPATVTSLLGNLVDELRAAHLGSRFLGLGVGMAGLVDREHGVCRYSPFLQWRDVPVRQLLEDRVQMPVIVENDVNALTLAERWFGAGAGSLNFLVVTLGAGVGMGLMLNGELYRGARDGAGEFGHSTVIEGGPLCNCGKRGCVEAYVGEPALRRAVCDATGDIITLDAAIERARAGDERLTAVFDNAGHTLGLGLAAVINVINPTLVIVGGEGAHFLDLLFPELHKTLSRHCFADLFEGVELVVEPWGDDVWARGAAGLMLDEFFHPPSSRDTGAEERPQRRGGRTVRPPTLAFPPLIPTN
jgi:N-acetylglucosamine repressor